MDRSLAPKPDSESSQAFLSMACDRALLSPAEASDVERKAAAQGTSASDVALREGVLSVTDVEMVQTLLRPVETIDGYEILDVLGRGGMGIVYRARQKALDREVALKTISLDLIDSTSIVARFEKEAQLVAKLRHPNIVTAYDFCRQSQRLCFVMEFLQGTDLDHYIHEHGRLDERTAWALARQAAYGLAHAASLGIVHRDIKPANLFLVEPPPGFKLPAGVPMVKLTDFGLALLRGDVPRDQRLTQAGTALGTPSYVAPEQLDNSSVDHRADIYSLGATVYHALRGRPPFEGSNLWEILAKKANGAMPSFDGLGSQATIALLSEMLAPHPNQRMPNYETLLERIERILNDSPATSSPSSDTMLLGATQEIHIGPRERHRSLLYTGAILLVGALVLGVAWWQGGGSQKPADEPHLEISRWAQPLFDGRSLTGWLPLAGSWSAATDAEGGKVLSGDGVIRRPFAPLSHFRISVGANLQKAKLVELHFSIEQPRAGEQSRLVLQISPESVILGRKLRDRGPIIETLSEPQPMARSSDAVVAAYHELRIERQPTRWLAYFHGEPLGSVPIGEANVLPEFRLVVEGGPALFDGLEIAELVPAEAK